MGLRPTFATLITSPLLPLLEGTLRELVQKSVADLNLPSSSELSSLHTHVDHARRAVAELQEDLEGCKASLEALQLEHGADAPSPSDDLQLRLTSLRTDHVTSAAKLSELQQGIAALGEQIAALRALTGKKTQQIDSAAKEASEVAQAADAAKANLAKLSAPKAKTPAKNKGCKVPGCDGKHRAKGFCGKHYQMYRRGTLPGFVTAEGHVFFEEEGPRWQVDAKLAGQGAAVVDGALTVGGQEVEAELLG